MEFAADSRFNHPPLEKGQLFQESRVDDVDRPHPNELSLEASPILQIGLILVAEEIGGHLEVTQLHEFVVSSHRLQPDRARQQRQTEPP